MGYLRNIGQVRVMDKSKRSKKVIDFNEARELRKQKRGIQAAKKAKSAAMPKRKNRARVFAKLYVVIIMALVAVACTIAYSVGGLQKDLEKAQYDNELAMQKKARLENELEHINDSENIEQQARTRLRMAKPDDVIYVIPEGLDEESASDIDYFDSDDSDGGDVVTDGDDGNADGDTGEIGANGDNTD
jgi:cell division protein FtsB